MCGVYGNVLQDLVEMLRFIPTHVGFTLKTDLDGLLKPGSSPRMWGLRCMVIISCAGIRFIPTYVGFTLASGIETALRLSQCREAQPGIPPTVLVASDCKTISCKVVSAHLAPASAQKALGPQSPKSASASGLIEMDCFSPKSVLA